MTSDLVKLKHRRCVETAIQRRLWKRNSVIYGGGSKQETKPKMIIDLFCGLGRFESDDDVISIEVLSSLWLLEIAVFICGKRVHRRKITKIELAIPTPRNFSEQGKKDVPTILCNAIHLGESLES